MPIFVSQNGAVARNQSHHTFAQLRSLRTIGHRAQISVGSSCQAVITDNPDGQNKCKSYQSPRKKRSMSSPNDRKFAESHEWHQIDGDVVTLGITQFAVNELADITYVEMKETGTSFDAGESIGEIESVKATSEIYCVAAGEILEINEALADDPSLVNSDPYGAGWLCKIKVQDAAPLESLMNADTYDEKFPT